MKQYKVEIIKEGVLGTLFFGSSKLPLKKMEQVMNDYGKNGWDVSFQIIEKHRLFLFWQKNLRVPPQCCIGPCSATSLATHHKERDFRCLGCVHY